MTDHASLPWLIKQKYLSGSLARWSFQLQGFSFTIKHRSGSQNVVADASSRCEEITDSGPIIDLLSKEFDSEEYIELVNRIKENQDRLPDLKVADKFAYKRTEPSNGDALQEAESWKLWVPTLLRDQVMYRAYDVPDSAHVGMTKMTEKLKHYLFWPGMVTQIRDHVADCSICKSTKSPNQIYRPPMGNPTTSDRPFQRLYMDLLGPYPRSKSGNIGFEVSFLAPIAVIHLR